MDIGKVIKNGIDVIENAHMFKEALIGHTKEQNHADDVNTLAKDLCDFINSKINEYNEDKGDEHPKVCGVTAVCAMIQTLCNGIMSLHDQVGFPDYMSAEAMVYGAGMILTEIEKRGRPMHEAFHQTELSMN